MVSCRFGRWFLRQTKKSRGFSEEYPSRVRLIEGYIKIKNYHKSQTLMTVVSPSNFLPNRCNLERLVLEGGTLFFRSTCGERRSTCMLPPVCFGSKDKGQSAVLAVNAVTWLQFGVSEDFRSSWLQSCSQVVNYIKDTI